MSERTIADHQAEFDQWYGEWLIWDSGSWLEKTPESLLSYFKARLCFTLGPLGGDELKPGLTD